MKIRNLLVLAVFGIFVGIASAVIYGKRNPTQPPLAASYNPYDNGVFATGIVESYQPTGSNINIYPEVSSNVIKIFVTNGQAIKAGDPILAMDDSVQREIVARDEAQMALDKANIANVRDQLSKLRKAHGIYSKSVSQNALDNAINSVNIAEAALKVSMRQYNSDANLLAKYIIKAPVDGVVMRIVPAVGDYISPVGTFDTYTQGFIPAVQMGVETPYLQVRAYVDEILVPRLPSMDKLQATMFIRGMNNVSVPLEYTSMQPYTIPNIQLSDQRSERVDVRVLPIIFKFTKPADINIFPGQLVDIYLKGKA